MKSRRKYVELSRSRANQRPPFKLGGCSLAGSSLIRTGRIRQKAADIFETILVLDVMRHAENSVSFLKVVRLKSVSKKFLRVR
jgi:hypothetical protein